MTKTKECGGGGLVAKSYLNVEKKKKMFVLSSSLRISDPYLLLESPRPVSPRQGPWTNLPRNWLFHMDQTLQDCMQWYTQTGHTQPHAGRWTFSSTCWSIFPPVTCRPRPIIWYRLCWNALYQRGLLRPTLFNTALLVSSSVSLPCFVTTCYILICLITYICFFPLK